MSDTKVIITPELVATATQRDSRHCMIAEAIKEGHPEYKSIRVDLATIRWTNTKTKKRYVALTPEIAAKALVDFDQGNEVEPFSFLMRHVQSTAVTTTVKDSTKASGYKHTAPSATRGLLADGTIKGGKPLPEGHLGGTSDVRVADRAAAKREEQSALAQPADKSDSGVPIPSESASNIKRSQPRYRQYGRRLLRQ